MLSRATHAAPQAPNTDEIQAQLMLLQSQHSITLYNPRPEPFQFEAGGRTYIIPPDLDGKVIDHPVFDDPKTGKPLQVIADGTLQVTAQMGRFGEGSRHKGDIIPFPLNGDPNRGPHGSPGRYMMVPGADAAFVAGVAIRNYGNTGISWLPDDPVKAEQIRLGAKERYRNWRRVHARTVLDNWHVDLAKWQAMPANKGKTPPRPGILIIKAQEELDAFATADTGQGGDVYTCEHCGYFSGDNEKFVRHMLASHNVDVMADRPPDEEKDLVPAVAMTRKRGRPKKSATAAA